MKEEHAMRVFENRVLSRPKREEVTGGWENCIRAS
jgi:hypothetical protein